MRQTHGYGRTDGRTDADWRTDDGQGQTDRQEDMDKCTATDCEPKPLNITSVPIEEWNDELKKIYTENESPGCSLAADTSL